MALILKPVKSCIPATDISYYDLEAEVADITLAATDRIHQRLQSAKMNIVEIGKDLALVKERLPHGMFGPWIEREFGWSIRTAQNYLSVARLASETSPDVIELLPSKVVYGLASKSTPFAVKAAILSEVEATGTPPETAAVLKQIADAKSATPKKKLIPSAPSNSADQPALVAAKMLVDALGNNYGAFKELMLKASPQEVWFQLDELEKAK